MNDYPSSHSMDTTFFAVDECGHVGIFNSGEEGAVPKDHVDAYAVWDGNDAPIAGELKWELARGTGHKTEARSIGHEELPGGGRRLSPPIAYGFFILSPGCREWAVMEVMKGDPGRETEEGQTRVQVGIQDGLVWARGQLSKKDWDWAHAPGEDRCLTCSWEGPLELDARSLMYGIFQYGCHGDNVPYARNTAPETPITASAFRQLFQAFPAAVPVFRGCFCQKELVQPIQYVPCTTYGSQHWQDERGTPFQSLPKD